ncbi:MAG: hydrolase [Flaviaesturariibacter sp.]|nr:hydrolase [Flaviaesturariibacter sp.]
MLQFNIRVYGILVSDGQLLVTDELIRGNRYTKFIGGGLEFGEGTRDCLKREFIEEMDLAVEIGEHLYTTDYFQLSAFNPAHQMMSIYYFVTPLEPLSVRLSETPFDFDEEQMAAYKVQNETQAFRFIPLQELNEESVTLPIDKIVVRTLLNRLTQTS